MEIITTKNKCMTKLLRKSEKIQDLLVIEPDIFHDFRGENLETFNQDVYEELFNKGEIENIKFVSDTFSFSERNVLRGFHGDPYTWKLVQCLRGRIFLVVIDVRTTSKTQNAYETFNINDKNRTQVLIPAGCVNAHLCMSGDCIFAYKQSHLYVPQKEQIHVKWNDPKYNIKWPVNKELLIFSERDS